MEHNLKFEKPNWWQRRPKPEKILLIIVAVLILLLIIVLSVNFSGDQMSQGRTGSCCKYGPHEMCFTSDCIKAANEVLGKIDTEVNPCDDFYQFACGRFLRNTVIPEDKSQISSFTIVNDEVEELMQNVFKKPITQEDIKPFVLTKTLYQACMNTKEIETNSLTKFKRLIKDTGGWPVIEGPQWDEDNFNWTSTTYSFMKLGFSSSMLIYFEVLPDVSNSSKNALFLNQIKLSLGEIARKGFNDTIFEAYYNYMTKVAVAFGADEKTASEEMKEVAELIIALAKITVPPEQRRNPVLENNPMTIDKMENDFDYLPWLEYINTMLSPYKKMTSDDTIIVKVPSYYRDLKDVLTNTPKRILANYMYWSLIEENINFLNNMLRNLELDFHKVASGIKTRPPRWKECTKKTIMLYVASGALFVRNFFNKEAKKVIFEIVKDIKNQFMKTLRAEDWMDPVTKRHAIEKAEAIHLFLAYPDELLDDQKLIHYYENLTFHNSDYLGCYLNWSLFTNNVVYPQLDEKLDRRDWRNHAYVALVEAFYDSSENNIEFLAGILRNVFFDSTKPKYMNYGAIGQIIGHEMTHGFDDKGRRFDKDGNLVNWWQNKTKEAFDAKAQCIINQYGNITEPEVNMTLNGLKTQGENIADNAGIKLAYLAYRNWVKRNGPEQVLPGLPYTPEQMFWISAANIWCEVHRAENLKLQVEVGSHAPSRYRVTVPLMNSEYFSENFNCKVGSKMNPKKKCQVW